MANSNSMVLSSVLNVLNSDMPNLQAKCYRRVFQRCYCESLLLMVMEITAAVSVSIFFLGLREKGKVY